jgi:hypothetical protein
METGSAGASVGACDAASVAASVGATDAFSVAAGAADVLGAVAVQPANMAVNTMTITNVKLTFFIVSSCNNSKFMIKAYKTYVKAASTQC